LAGAHNGDGHVVGWLV
jgi:hypothetical protein